MKLWSLKEKLNTELNLKEIKFLLKDNGQTSNDLSKEMVSSFLNQKYQKYIYLKIYFNLILEKKYLQCLCDVLMFGPPENCQLCIDGVMVFK